MITIREATDEDLDAVRTLFRDYAEWLGEDLAFQGFEEELARLPWPYDRPGGCILVATEDEYYAGCIAVKPRDAGRCEMKRLYVRHSYRGSGVGRLLANAIVAEARAMGYKSMVLDTLERMAPARKLYQSLGFLPTEPYYDNPLPGVQYLELRL